MADLDFHIVRMESDPFLPAFVFGAANTENGIRGGGKGAKDASVGFGDMPIADGQSSQAEESASSKLARTEPGTDGPSLMTSPVIDLASAPSRRPPQP